MLNFTISGEPIDIYPGFYIMIIVIIINNCFLDRMFPMYRKSKQKEAIIRVIKESRIHPDAEWIYEKVRHEIPSISLGTVYRNLKSLKEKGMITEIHPCGEISHYDGNTRGHYHFRCDRCGAIVDLDESIDKSIEERVARKTGFKVTHHTLELGGLCTQCLQLTEKPRSVK